MRRTLRFTRCIATASLGLAVASSALHAEEPPAEKSGNSLQEAAEAAQVVAEEVVEEVQRAAGEAAAKIAAEAQRAAEGAAREATDAARQFAEQARGKIVANINTDHGHRIGLQVTAVPRSLDAQLKLDGKGVLVDGVTKEGPAEKAGIQANDVLLSVDGAPLASAKDLQQVIQAAEGKEIKIKLLRGGEEQEFTVTPHKNVLFGSIDGQLDKLAPKREEVEIEIRNLEERIREKLKDAGLDVRMHLVRPGHFVPTQIPRLNIEQIPDEVSILIQKQGEAPAKIEIKQGEKSWSATEGNLEELPDEVRPYAERMLIGRGPAPFKISVPARPAVPARPSRPRVSFTTPDGKTVTANSIEMNAQTPQTRERHRGNLEHRIEELSSEIERVSEKMDSLRRELKAQSQRGKE